MQCEMRAATVLRRSGWSPDMFVPGVAIKIAGRPHRDDPHYCYADTLTIGEAPTLQRYQQLGQLSGNAPANRAADRPLRLASGKPNLAGDWAQEQYIMARPPQGPPTSCRKVCWKRSKPVKSPWRTCPVTAGFRRP